MSVLVFVENHNGKLKKSAHEVASFGSALASKLGTDAVAITLGSISESELGSLGANGISKVLHANDARFDSFDSRAFSKAIAAAADKLGTTNIVLSFSMDGKGLAGRLSAKLKAGLVTGAVELPEGDTVKKAAFSNKGFANFTYNTDKKIIALNPNSYPVTKGDGAASVEAFDAGLSDADFSVKVTNTELAGGGIPLPEAELVVSAGRGLKGPENWGMIEEMADILGAATACSRAVSDVDWRPHHEHVGQTGLAITPNLYIAVAISGAIQHLAGVSGSKTIVVINIDPEAPFFKNADYGIVGDAFEVVPKLNEALKAYKAGQN